MGTRLSPRTCRVRPVATKFFTAESRFSPPRASLACARMAFASFAGACAGDEEVDTARSETAARIPINRKCPKPRILVPLPDGPECKFSRLRRRDYAVRWLECYMEGTRHPGRVFHFKPRYTEAAAAALTDRWLRRHS